ncbi:hypothetical protein [Dyadobacter sp. CY326]|uniref:hypothetical protein n=1 Tax=Dyadobacter sp. CY326 TaxID=2907300 RepID=UPI001F2C0682|nr:hypothetical protein [Dyadobacter sp. CY326]MCE7066813.1 hypothetical protein [Dyadobacter sp. CY326]
MKRLLYIPLCIALLLSCTEKEDMSAMTAYAFETIQGKWYLTAVEKNSIDGTKNIWEQVAAGKADTLVFRADGVVLDASGKPACCVPGAFIINGNLMEVRPQTAVPANPLCASVNCVNCPSWDIQLNGNEMIMTQCNKPRLKFIR